MNPLALACALFLFSSFADRLRQICWGHTKSRFVVLYLLNAMWSLSLLYDAATGVICAPQFIGVGAMLALLYATRPNWSDGMPAAFRRAGQPTQAPDL